MRANPKTLSESFDAGHASKFHVIFYGVWNLHVQSLAAELLARILTTSHGLALHVSAVRRQPPPRNGWQHRKRVRICWRTWMYVKDTNCQLKLAGGRLSSQEMISAVPTR